MECPIWIIEKAIYKYLSSLEYKVSYFDKD